MVASETRKHHLYFQPASPSSASTVGCCQLHPLAPRSRGQGTQLACKGSGWGARRSLKDHPSPRRLPGVPLRLYKETLSHERLRLATPAPPPTHTQNRATRSLMLSMQRGSCAATQQLSLFTFMHWRRKWSSALPPPILSLWMGHRFPESN